MNFRELFSRGSLLIPSSYHIHFTAILQFPCRDLFRFSQAKNELAGFQLCFLFTQFFSFSLTKAAVFP